MIIRIITIKLEHDTSYQACLFLSSLCFLMKKHSNKNQLFQHPVITDIIVSITGLAYEKKLQGDFYFKF